MMIQVQNVTFFRKKNMFLIARGMKKVWLAFNQEGDLMIKLKGFDRYWFDPDTCDIFSKKSDKTYSPLKKYTDGKRHYFFLYDNGVQTKVFLAHILKENMKGIELFFDGFKSISPLSH